jgi:hypothetical protein
LVCLQSGSVDVPAEEKYTDGGLCTSIFKLGDGFQMFEGLLGDSAMFFPVEA